MKDNNDIIIEKLDRLIEIQCDILKILRHQNPKVEFPNISKPPKEKSVLINRLIISKKLL